MSPPSQPLDRRQWLMQSSLLTASLQSLPLPFANPMRSASPSTSPHSRSTKSSRPVICVFGKSLQQLSIEELAKLLSQWPIDGLEATVRAAGQIEPAVAAESLPRLMQALRDVERSTLILATDINRADHVDIQRVLEPASKLGIVYFRMAYYHYQLDQPLLPQLDRFAKQAKELATVCRELKLQGLYQNHAGATYVGGPLWDLQEVLEEVSPDEIGVAFDIRHAAVEAISSWQVGYQRLQPRLRALFVKDAAIVGTLVQDVPLGHGIAKPLFDHAFKMGLPGPISLQMEYVDHQDPQFLTKRIEALRQDITTLNQWLAMPNRPSAGTR